MTSPDLVLPREMTKIDITYCRPCGYEKRARIAADAIQQSLGFDAEIHPGGGGIFEVRVNDQVVAKRTRNHFPDATEIVRLVSESMALSAGQPTSRKDGETNEVRVV